VQAKWAEAVLKVANPRQVPAAEMNAAVASFTNYTIWLVPALLRRADALLREGDLPGATRDLETVTNGVHGLSRRQANRALRGAVLEQARDRFDRLVMLYLHAGRNEDALLTLERGRLSFAPWDSVAPLQERPAAPPGHVALEYALIGDTLVTWTVRGGTVRVTRQRVDREAFRLTVEQVGAALESPGREAGADAGLRRLYDWLIRPVRDSLGGPGTPLVILADGEVAGVPFAALLDSARGRYLARDHPLRFASTLADAARAVPLRPLSGPALLVADPAFDPGRHPTLFPLDSARAEVNSLRRLYPHAVSLEGGTATRAAFVANLREASVVHYAGHAVFDDTRPERSYLVLAGADTTGRLTAEALRAMRLPGVRLVVLSACRTLRSREGRSGGFAGFSGALLTAGAGGVVGSLWQVNDTLTGPLMEEFHREYLRSRDPADALWKAQLAMLDSKNPRLSSPATWAGFRYTGARRP
jgi:CHAT domain-containing protein